MRQVPTNLPLSRPAFHASDFYPLLLGGGRLFTHLHHYFHLVDFAHKHFDGSLRGELNHPDFDRKLKATNAVWILVSDDAIEEVCKKVKARIHALGLEVNHYQFIHSSAATQIDDMTTIHPLMAFGENLYSIEQYEKIPLVTFAGEDPRTGAASAPKLDLPNPQFTAPVSQRAFYHASAVMMSNLPVLLWSEVTKYFQARTEINPIIFKPILEQTVQNFLNAGPSALTGPIARNDQRTIKKNLTAIENTPLHSIYEVFLALNRNSAKKSHEKSEETS